MINTRPFM